MASTVPPAPHLNGSGVAPDPRHEAEFLDKLLQIRDQVFASKHPRIHLPPAVLERVAPRPTPQQPPSQPAFPRAPVNNAPASIHPPQNPPRSEIPPQNQAPKTDFGSTAQTARPFSAKPTSSGIDPVLLTKSDHLIRAELQLKRQQIERAIKDQFDRKGRGNEASADDREPYVDVDAALAKAQALVKPLSALQPAAQSEGSTSFDENSYYSSRGNSWSSERDGSNQTTRSANAAEGLVPPANPSPPAVPLTAVHDGVPPDTVVRATQPAVIDLEEDAYEPTEDIEVYEPEPVQISEEQEESDYSPPPASAGQGQGVPGQGRPRDPTRGRNGGTNGSSRRQSPAGNAPPLQNPRKRRREERKRQQANKRVVRSPEPYIKEEPQSPPPFNNYPDVQPNKRRALQPLPNNLELEPAYGRAQATHYMDQEHSPRSYRPYEEPHSPTVIHVPQRRIDRDDQDLRRVASLQHARRPYSPGALEPYHPIETRPVRASSHVFTERPVEPVYQEISRRSSVAPQYLRERSRSPVREYLAPQSPVVMAPPARRIVVDQFGNKYYAAPVNVRESVAPSRRVEAEPYYERAVTREPVRAPAGMRTEVYEEDGIMRMPPPPPRRYVEVADPELVEARPYRHREASHRPMEVEYAARGLVERRPVMQYEEMGPPREYMPSRAFSMRPEGARREVAEGYPSMRHESVAPRYVSVAAPRYREVSVVHADRPDQHRYAFAAEPQERRYVEEEGRDRPMEAALEGYSTEPRRVSYRY